MSRLTDLIAKIEPPDTLELRGATSGKTVLAVPAVAGDITLTLPAADGVAGQPLVTDGSGNFAVDDPREMTGATWSITTRYGFTATLLNTGKVLYAGGTLVGTGASDKSCWLYDMATHTWTATGALSTGRWEHTATLLTDGTVLVAGGCNEMGVINTAEIFDPTGNGGVGSWSNANGTMVTGRYQHMAVKLSDDDVLLVSGFDTGNNALDTAEIFDHTLKTFAASTDTMTTPRLNGTITLLADNTVLLVGGDDGEPTPAVLDTAEVYTRGSPDTFVATIGSMAEERHFHTATLLADDTVLIAGGVTASAPVADTSYIFDPTPAVQTFTSTTGEMSVSRYMHRTIKLSDDSIMVVGGFTGTSPGFQKDSIFFDPTAGTWSSLNSSMHAQALCYPRYNANNGFEVIRLDDDTMVAIGGGNAGDASYPMSEYFGYDDAGQPINLAVSSVRGTVPETPVSLSTLRKFLRADGTWVNVTDGEGGLIGTYVMIFDSATPGRVSSLQVVNGIITSVTLTPPGA
jgi:hypothetical protein